MKGFNSVMLPANVEPGIDGIPIEERNKRPIAAVKVTQGARISRRPDTASPDYNSTEVVSVDAFPKIRGW